MGVTYDALGRMVEQARGSSYTEIVYGPSGGKLALMTGQTLSKAFMPLPGGATAVYNASGLAYYRHADWLGSARLASTPSRGVYYDGAYAPYGEPYVESASADRSFTGQNQDTVAGLYDFMFREYHPVQGRWISPDPAGLAAVDPANPQTWNAYAYAINRPNEVVDPLGLQNVHVTNPGPDPFESAGWNSLRLLTLAYQPTFGILVPDPEFVWNGQSTLYLFYGNWDLIKLLEIGLSGNIARELGPNLLSEGRCARGLTNAKSNQGAVNRAKSNMPALDIVGSDSGVDPAILAAIGVRETGFRNSAQPDGLGRGIFQIDLGQHPDVSLSTAFDPLASGDVAAGLLNQGFQQYAILGPRLALAAGIRDYNARPKTTFMKAVTGGIRALDRGTARGNYVSNVLDLVDCFQ